MQIKKFFSTVNKNEIMSTKQFIALSVIAVLTIFIAWYGIFKASPQYKMNAYRLHDYLAECYDAGQEDLVLDNELPFKWDKIYAFAPMTPSSYIYKVVGYDWGFIWPRFFYNSNSVVFMDGDKVVCVVDGHKDNFKMFFDFDKFEGQYIELHKSQHPDFFIRRDSRGIINCRYIFKNPKKKSEFRDRKSIFNVLGFS